MLVAIADDPYLQMRKLAADLANARVKDTPLFVGISGAKNEYFEVLAKFLK